MLHSRRRIRIKTPTSTQNIALIVDNTRADAANRRIDKWGSALLRFAMLVVVSVVLWTVIAFGLWKVADRLW